MTEIIALVSGAFRAAYPAIVEGFERASGHTVATTFGGSVGDAPTSIPSRLRAGEPFDLVIVNAETLDTLIEEGHVRAGSRVDVARSFVGVVARAGAATPDLGSAASFRRAVEDAPSIALSNSATGQYLLGLFDGWGIGDAMRAKRVQGEASPVASVAAGDAALAFGPVSELITQPGVTYAGRLPTEIEHVTIFSGGTPTLATNLDAASALLTYLTSEDAAGPIEASGMARA